MVHQHDPHQQIPLASLFEQYIKGRKKFVSPGTWNNGYLVALHHIQRSPFSESDSNRIDGKQGWKLCEWIILNSTPDSARRVMMQLNACYNWAIDQNIIKVQKSPFDGLASKVRKRYRSAMSIPMDVEFFTAQERDIIINAFQEHEHYSHYWNYVRFSFYTGCRPSEAIGLRWTDIAPDWSRLTFRRAVVTGEDGRLEVRQKLKTQKWREFPCNEQLQEILKDQKAKTDLDLVFPGFKGGFMNRTNFQVRAWKSILSKLSIYYRKPYCMRHSFITLCLDRGLNVKDVARLVGNSPEIIYKHYAGSHSISVPTL